MKSLRYRLGGAPKAFDDFLDFARTTPLQSVTLELLRRRIVVESGVFIELIARFTWQFSGFQRSSEELCGTYRVRGTSGWVRPDDYGRADELLRRRIAQVEALGVPLHACEGSFEALAAVA